MSEVSPFNEQFELTHAIVWGGQYLTLGKLYRMGMSQQGAEYSS